MERELMTVKEFAEYLGISPQAIYKRLNNPNNELNNFVQSEFNGQKIIDKRAEALFCKPRLNNVEQPTRAEALDVLRAELEAYRDQLKVKDDQLKAKDNQIAEMQQTINTLTAAVTSALNQQQALNAAATLIQKQLIDGAAEASKDTGAGTSSTGTATATPSAGAADNKQRRGIFGALDTIRAKFKR